MQLAPAFAAVALALLGTLPAQAESAPAASSSITYPASCDEAFETGVRRDGIFVIQAEGAGMNALCHFETRGELKGGWTVIAYQSGPHSMIDWWVGIHPQRLPHSYLAASFALAPSQVPPHEEMAVGWITPQNTIQILEPMGRAYPSEDETITPEAAEYLSIIAAQFPGVLLLVK